MTRAICRRTFIAVVVLVGAASCRTPKRASSPTVLATCEEGSDGDLHATVAPPSKRRPVANLKPAWRRKGPAVSGVAPGAMALSTNEALVVVDPADGRKIGEIRAIHADPPFAAAYAMLPGRLAVLETFVAKCPDQPDCTTTADHLVGFSAGNDAPAWTIDLGLARARRELRAIDLGDSSLWMVLDGDVARAFDATGHEQWSTILPGVGVHPVTMRAAAGRLLVGTHDRTSALHPRRGCASWSVDEAILGGDDARIVTFLPGHERALRVRDAATGAVRHAITTETLPFRVALFGDVLTVLTASDSSVVAYDMKSGAVLWRRSPVATWAPTDDALFVTDHGCVVRALDPPTGTVQYEYAMACNDTGCLPHLRIVADGQGDGIALDHHELVVLTRAETPSSVVSKTITGVVEVDGKPAPRVRVAVGEQVVRTDEAGRYSARVTTPGNVLVIPSSLDVKAMSKLKDVGECFRTIVGLPEPPPPIPIEGQEAAQTVSFDLRVELVCIGI